MSRGWKIFWYCVGAFFLFNGTIMTIMRLALRPAATNYGAYNMRKICDDAFQTSLDYRDQEIANFTLTLSDGCFGPAVRLPKVWRSWWYQPTGKQDNWWIAFWVIGQQNPRGPFGPNDKPDFNSGPGFRLQGHGQVLLYSNDVLPAGATTAKPDADGVYSVKDGVTPPVVISKVEADYTPEARRANFSGTVSATVIVGEDGSLRDIRINNPPGYGLEEKVIEALHQWKVKPGKLNGKPVPTRTIIDITFRQL